MSSTMAQGSVTAPMDSKQPPDKGLKRKLSLDEAVAAAANDGKRAKCSTATANGVGGGIATNTIMITNNYSKNGMTPTSTTTTTTSKSSKITILTHDDDDGEHDPTDPDGGRLHHHRPMVVDQINICINNHFSSDSALMTTTTSATAKIPDLIKIQKKLPPPSVPLAPVHQATEPKLGYEADVKEEKLDAEQEVRVKQEPIEVEEEEVESPGVMETEEKSPIPSLRFSIGEEVLVHRVEIDDCFYLGILTVIRDDQGLVQFEDGSNCWSPLGDIKRLLRQPNTIYCVICKQRYATDTAEGKSSTVCLSCGRAYHRACIQTELDSLQLAEKRSSENINCLRCFKRESGIDETLRLAAEPVQNDLEEVDQSQDMANNKTNSSNTGNSSSVINQVEIGTPSMDWFTKERKGDDGGSSMGINEEPGADDDDDADGDSEPKLEDEYFKFVNGRYLRKRQPKTKNVGKLKRNPGAENGKSTTFPSPSWSCSSSTSSTTSSSGWCSSSVMFTGTSMFSLDELRWAFLPKARKLKRRSSKKAAADSGRPQMQSMKVPYERATAVTITRGGGDMEERPQTARVSSHEGEMERDLKWNSIYETKSRLARGDRYNIRGKRQDHLGTVQYLIEWESGAA